MAILSLMLGAIAGKSIGGILFDEQVRLHCSDLSGRVLDLAGGIRPGYLGLLPRDVILTRTNRTASEGVESVNFNEPLPYRDASYDSVLFFNALYIADDAEKLLKEILRVIANGGRLFLSSPLIADEVPEPHDYLRYTHEGPERVLLRAGFKNVRIERVGERGSAAMTILSPFLGFNIIRALLCPVARLFDMLVPERIRRAHPNPILYFCTCTK